MTSTVAAGIARYTGVRGTPRLIASSNPNAEDSIPNPRRNPIDAGFHATKRFFPIGNHPITDLRETRLLPLIIPKNSGGWWAAYCVRLGFDYAREQNPVVLLVLVALVRRM